MGHESWPWPQQVSTMPRGQKWWKSIHPSGTVAHRVRGLELKGDLAVLALIGFFFYKAVTSDEVYRTRNSFLTGQPPALVAQNFDFSDNSNNRTLSRERLQEYRNELAQARLEGKSGAEVAFKY